MISRSRTHSSGVGCRAPPSRHSSVCPPEGLGSTCRLYLAPAAWPAIPEAKIYENWQQLLASELKQILSIEFFHNCCLIRWTHEKKYKKFRDLTSDWTQVICLAVSHSNHYIRKFSVLMWGCIWIVFMLGWFCPTCLIHQIGQKFLHFEKKLDYVQEHDPTT